MVLSGLIFKIQSNAIRVVHFTKLLNRKELYIFIFQQLIRRLRECWNCGPNPLLGTKY